MTKQGTAYTPIRMTRTRTLTAPNTGENVEPQELSFTAGGDAAWCGHFARRFGSFLQN